MDFNQKFLKCCIKPSKALFCIVLAAALVVTAFLALKSVYLTYKVNNNKISYNYNVKKAIAANYTELKDLNKTVNTNKIDKTKENAINFIKKENLDSFCENELLGVLDKVNPNERKRFLNSYIKYHNSYKETFTSALLEKEIILPSKKDEFLAQNNINLFKDTIANFVSEYNIEDEALRPEKIKFEVEKVQTFNAFLTSFLILILLLYLPILIKIENNTRITFELSSSNSSSKRKPKTETKEESKPEEKKETAKTVRKTTKKQ